MKKSPIIRGMKKKYIFKIVKKIILFIFVTYIIYIFAQKYFILKYYYDYTNGIIIKVNFDRVASKRIFYSYTIDGITYERSMIIDERLPCEEVSNGCHGKQIQVKYLPWNPKVSRAVID